MCGEPNCPDIKEFKLGPWGGPSPAQVDSFNNFNFGISPNFPGEITKGVNDALDDFFGEDSQTSVSPGNCYTGSFECGIPQIVLFGGGGSGAAAQVVINKIGQVIGSNLLSGGSGYTSTPFVSVEDPAGCGNNASASAVLGTLVIILERLLLLKSIILEVNIVQVLVVDLQSLILLLDLRIQQFLVEQLI